MKRRYLFSFVAVLELVAGLTALSQPVVQVYATGLTNPIGVTVDARGNLWVGEQGTGSGLTSRVSVVTPDGKVHPFVTGIPSNRPAGEPIGAEHVAFDIDGKLLIVSGGTGTAPYMESIIVFDTTGFKPGGTPSNVSARDTVYNIGAFVRARGGTPNPYRVAVHPNGDWYIVDASFNAILRRERTTGTLSLFCAFASLGQIEAVPTGIAYNSGGFFVGSLTGIPIPTGAASVYRVNAQGAVNIAKSGFTGIVDIAMNPVDNSLILLQHGKFAGGWVNGTGTLLRMRGSFVDTLLTGLNRPAGLAFGPDGALYITSLVDGNVLKLTGLNTLVQVKPVQVNFGPILLSSADTLSVMIQNVDTLSHTILGISLPGHGFSVAGVPAFPALLPGRSSLAFRVAFRPLVAGSASDSLLIQTDDPFRPAATIGLTGAGETIAAVAARGNMYAVKAGVPAGEINSVDTKSGITKSLTAFSLPRVDALAIRRGTGELYGTVVSGTSTALYRIDPNNGRAALLRRIPVGNMYAVVFANGDTLYGGTRAGALYRIDLVSGSYRQVGVPTGIPYGSFAMSPTTRKLWASAQTVPDSSDTLYTVDPSTGAAARVGSTGMSLHASLAFDSTGALYGLAGAGNAFNSLITIDVATGAGTQIGTDLLENFCAMATRVDGALTGVPTAAAQRPLTYSLEQNYPNPFNPTTAFSYELSEVSDVKLAVYDLLGREVSVLVNERQSVGRYELTFDARGLASGTYVYLMRAGGFAQARKMTILK